MITVFFYNVILLTSTFFVWLSEKGQNNIERWLMLYIAFLLVFTPSAIRYDIGTDYLNYLAIYNDNWRIPLDYFRLKEPAFYFINWFFGKLGAHFQWVFASFAFIFTAAAFKTYKRKDAWLLHFLFFTSLWFFSFNGIRQAIAIACCFLALFYYFDKRYLYFLALTIIASMFHRSAIFIIAAGGLALIPISEYIKARIAPMVFIGFIFFTFISMHIVLKYIKEVLNILGLIKYAAYFSSERHLSIRDFGTGVGVLVKVLFSTYLIYNTKHFIRLNNQYWLLAILTCIYTASVVLAGNIIIFSRMADAFVIAPIVGAYLLLQVPINTLINRIILILFLIFQLLAFTKGSLGVPTSYGDPKLNPYKTVLQEKLNESI